MKVFSPLSSSEQAAHGPARLFPDITSSSIHSNDGRQQKMMRADGTANVFSYIPTDNVRYTKLQVFLSHIIYTLKVMQNITVLVSSWWKDFLFTCVLLCRLGWDQPVHQSTSHLHPTVPTISLHILTHYTCCPSKKKNKFNKSPTTTLNYPES